MAPFKSAKLLCIPFALLVLAGCRGGEETGSSGVAPGLRSPRRVFLITVDTLRADHMSLYGYPRATSPSLDRLAATGVTFDQAICQWPKTGSSFASIFTGLYPHTTGLTHKAALRIPDSYFTLPELFQESGYETFAVISNAALAAKFGWNTGFDDFAETWGGGEFSSNPRLFRPLARAPKVNELAVPLLRKHARAERLFAWIHYSDPHAPYILPEGRQNRFLGDAVFHGFGDRPVPVGATKSSRLEDRTDLKYYVAQYDANVLVADEYIEKLLGEMRSLGLLKDSLVIFTADHGESLGEHDSWFDHGPLPYNTTARVPLFLVMDGLPAGRRVERPVELVDLYPTLRDLIAPDRKVPGLEGHSLWPLLRDGATERTGAFRQAFASAGKGPNLYHSVQESTWKLVFNADGERSRAAHASTAAFELYDLDADPLETRNLAAAKPEEMSRLRRDLVAWMQQARAHGDEDEGADAETERALRALGYVN